MESPRTTWTDARLDDLADRITTMDCKIDARFDSIDATLLGR